MDAVTLERPNARRAAEFLSAVRRSRSLHRGWVTPPADAASFKRYLAGLRRQNREGFLIVVNERHLAGVVNVSEIVRGAFQSAYLGYYAFEPFARRGVMRQGLELVISHCFRRLKLHRLEANVQPANRRSIALVRTLGFKREGFSPRYLKVAGRWRDHERWALLVDDWQQLRRRR